MKFLQRLGAVLNVKPGEGKLVLLFFLHAFFVGTVLTFTRTGSYTLFLEKFDAKILPFVYMIVALAGTTITGGYLRLEKHLSLNRSTLCYLSFIFAGLTFFRLTLFFTDSKWFTFLLPVWNELLLCLINIESGVLAARIFTVRQSKRLLGLVDSGQFAAEITVGSLMGVLVRLIGTPNLLFMAAMGAGCAMVLAMYLFSLFYNQTPSREVHKEAIKEKDSRESRIRSAEMIKKRYILFIFVFYILFIFSHYFVDNAFYEQVSVQFRDDKEVAAFLGQFYALYGFLSLVLLTFCSGMVLSRFGLRTGMLILPVGITTGAIAVVLADLLHAPLALIFWFTAMTRMIKMVLNSSFNRPSRTILFQVLPVEQRSWTQTTLYGMADPLFSGITGGVLLILMNYFFFGTVQLFRLLLLILSVWIGVAILTHREYLAALIRTINKRQAKKISFNLKESSTISVIKKGLNSSYPAEVIYCLNVLQEMEYEGLEAILIGLLDHPDDGIRREALQRIEQLRMLPALDAIRRRFEIEKSSQVRGEALRTLASLSETEIVEEIAPYLEDADPKVRMGAMVGLLRSGGIEGVLTAGEALIALVNSPHCAERKFAARVFGEIAIPGFYRPLLKLIRDEDPEVCKAALEASGKLKNPRLFLPVSETLKIPKLRSAAISALVAMGERILPDMETLFNKEGEVRVRIIDAIGKIQGERAVAALEKRMDFPDEEIRHAVLNALCACGYQTVEKNGIRRRIEAEVAEATRTLACLADLDGDASMSVLKRALIQKVERNRERVLLLLSFIYPPQSILRAKSHLVEKTVEQRAYALEVIENTVSNDLRDLVFPLIETSDPKECLKLLDSWFPQQRKTQEEHLWEMASGNQNWITPWIRCCALYIAGRLPMRKYDDLVVSALSSPHPLVRETAVWALGRMNSGNLQGRLRNFLRDDSERVSKMARCILNQQGGKLVLSTIEKIIILKTVNIFSEIPDDELAELASRIQEVEVAAGDSIIKAGELGTSMYIVVNGKVRVHVGNREVTVLGERAVFGELAALDPEPRSASITALEDTLLFSVDQDTLYELMAEQVKMARGIIRVLCQRLRSAVQSRSV